MIADFHLLTSVELDQPDKTIISDSNLSSTKRQKPLQLQLYQHLSGLQVLFVATPGPASLATIVVPTLCEDNYGLPHTLEHLVFCGSKHYPIKGYLEALATRLLSTGTNAWTSSDHTAYTLSTVGHDALIHAVPVFLDHVLNPTLSEPNFITEVYHIDGKAKQQGVVFSEMGSREYSEADLLDRTLNQIMYNNTTTYSYECGGLTESIAQLSVEMIQDYHRRFYRLENVCIILTGQDLPHEAILESLNHSPSLKDYSLNTLPPQCNIEFPAPNELLETKVVSFPSEDDTCGSIGYAWRGPNFEDFSTRFALDLLLFCFTDSPAAPLNQAIVAPELPLANTISYDVRLTPETSLWIQFSGVPKGDIAVYTESDNSECELDLRELLKPGVFRSTFLPILTSAISELNIELIQEGITRYRIMLLESLEDNACEDLTQSLVPAIVADRFYSIPLVSSLSQISCQFNELAFLQSQPLSFWQSLAHTWLLDQAPAEVIAIPDIELGKTLESKRLAAQAERAQKLGPAALDLLKKKIESAVTNSKIVLDEEIMSSLPPIPDINKLPQLPSTVNTTSLEPFFSRTQVVQVDTQFTRFMVGLSTQNISEDLQPYLVLFQNLLFQLDLNDPEKGSIEYQDAIRNTDRLTVERFASLGLGNRGFSTNWLPELFFIGAKTETGNLESAVEWLLRNLMFCTFTIERVLSAARNLLSELEETLRDGAELTQAVYRRILQSGQDYDTRLEVNISAFRQEEFINDVISELTRPDSSHKILNQLSKLRDTLLTSIQGGVLQFSSPIGFFSNPETPVNNFNSCWNNLFNRYKAKNSEISAVSTEAKIGLRAPYSFPSNPTHSPCLILPLGSLTSSFAVSIIPCEVFDNTATKMAVGTMCELLSRCNGPLFELIRGQGLAYHVSMYLQIWSGNLVLELHDATDPSKAMLAVWDFLNSLREEEIWKSTITLSEMSLAKAALAYTSTRYVDCPSAIVDGAFKYMFWGFASTEEYVKHYRAFLANVSMADLRSAFLTYMVDFLNPKKTQIVILTPSSDSSSGCGNDLSDCEDDISDSGSQPASVADTSNIIESLSTTPYGFNFQEGCLSLF